MTRNELRTLGLLMSNWHRGMSDPIYMVGSVLREGRFYPDIETVLDAQERIESLDRGLALNTEHRTELHAILGGLALYLLAVEEVDDVDHGLA